MKNIIAKPVSSIYQIFKDGAIEESQAYNPQKITIIVETIIHNAFIIGVIFLFLFVIWKWKRHWLSKAIVVATIIELFTFSKGNMITVPLSIGKQNIPVRQWLTKKGGYDRFFSTSGNMAFTGLGVYWTHLRAREPFSPNKLTKQELSDFSRFKKELSVLPENQGMQDRLFDVAGYAATVPENFLKFWTDKPQSPNSAMINNPADPKLDIVGAKYFITGYPQDFIALLSENKFKLTDEVEEIFIYENTSAWPRAFLLDNEKIIPAIIQIYEPNYTNIHSNHSQKTQLVLTDTFYPGWEAQIDGAKMPIGKYLGTFRSVRVPAGEHEVEFRFKPKSVLFGAIISLATLLALIINLTWSQKRKLPSFF
jgi:hypothetical protein